MLGGSVNLSSDGLVTVATPECLACERTIRPPSMTKILCIQMDSICFSQLSEAAMAYLHVAYYRNQLLHLFVKDAMLALCLAPESDYGIYNWLPTSMWLLQMFLCLRSNCARNVLCSTLCFGVRIYFVKEVLC